MSEKRTERLRVGRTTGSCAAAAAMAGTMFLLTDDRPTCVAVPLPPGGELDVPIDRIENEGDAVRVTVVKDGGDDPDVTHGHEVQALVSMEATDDELKVDIDGGRGVGRVTLPGLPVPVGEPAINPQPREQIEAAVRLATQQTNPPFSRGRVSVIVEVPEGETVARATMNPRLGIVGGISVLGTQGVVKPYSHESWTATIEEGLDVARALGMDRAIFTTGRRSERLYLETFPNTAEQALIQAADFFEFAMQAAARRGFANVVWSVFFGKLVKQAQGLPYTHARTHPVDFDRLADWCAEAGCASRFDQTIRTANTARQVLGVLADDPARPKLVASLVAKAKAAAERFSGGGTIASYAVFDFDGQRLN